MNKGQPLRYGPTSSAEVGEIDFVHTCHDGSETC